MSVLYDGGILRFGPAPPDWEGSSGSACNWLGLGVVSTDDDPTAFGAVAWETLGGWDGANSRGTWLVLRDDRTHPDWGTARVVDSPVFDTKQDASVLRLTAEPGRFVAVQTRAIRLHPSDREADGSWGDMRVDGIAVRDAGSTDTLTARIDLFTFDRTGLAGVDAYSVWIEDPPSGITACTSWPALTLSLEACFVAVRLMLIVDAGASGEQTVYFREPAIAWKGDIMGIGRGNFAPRYTTL